MWLLKIHFGFSILCLLTFLGFKSAFNEHLEKEYNDENNSKKGSIFKYFYFFVPILNVIFTVAIIVMCFMKKEDLLKAAEKMKEDK